MIIQNKIDEIITILKSAGEVYTELVEDGINKLEELKGYKPNVKELEWRKERKSKSYYAMFNGEIYCWIDALLELSIKEFPIGKYKTLEDAKSVAQEHFNNLIISCLE